MHETHNAQLTTRRRFAVHRSRKMLSAMLLTARDALHRTGRSDTTAGIRSLDNVFGRNREHIAHVTVEHPADRREGREADRLRAVIL